MTYFSIANMCCFSSKGRVTQRVKPSAQRVELRATRHYSVFTNLSRNSHLPTGLGNWFGPVTPFYFHFPFMNQSVYSCNPMPVLTRMGGMLREDKLASLLL